MSFRIEGDVTVPGDKSLSHRALMLAAVAKGESRLRGLLFSEDTASTATVLTALGTPFPDLPHDGSEVRVISRGLRRWTPPSTILDCGNSGTTARLMMGLLAGRPFCATLTGDASLRSRPMRRITRPLESMGASARELETADRLPIELCGGKLKPIDYRSPKASAQIKSAVLFAGVSGGVPVSLREPVQSRDHSERMLAALGVDLTTQAIDGEWEVRLQPPDALDELAPLDMDVPGDPSSAAFLAALAALADAGELRIRNVGVNPTRIGFIDAMRRMGARLDLENERLSGGEPIADLVVSPGELRAIELGGAEIPAMIDEVPVLACLAARIPGETRFTGADELRAKETDRITAVVDNLRRLGADAEELPDGLVVRGSDRPLSGTVACMHDHRIAMAFGVLAALPGNSITFDTPRVVDVSFPRFWEVVGGLSAAPLPR